MGETTIEEIARTHDGVDRVFAMQAGREVRVMVLPEAIDDLAAQVLARDIAKQIEEGAPAELFTVDGGPGTVGIIASVTRPFCGDCDRTRLTADGQVRTCLFSQNETDLRALVRGGGTDEDIAQAWRTATWGKLPGHGINDPSFLQPDRPMSAIGG